MMRWIPCEPWHLLEIKPQPMQAGAKTPDYWTDGKDPLAVQMLHDNCRTLLVDDRPIACVGGRPVWDGVVEAWTLLSLEAIALPREPGKQHPLTVAMDAFIRELAERDGVWRFQSFIDCEHAAAIQWIETLGFAYEGRLIRFSPLGRDMYVYARIF